MKAKRWTLGVVLVAAVSLWGLVEADASPFSSYILSDDIGNMVRGSAAEADGSNDSANASSTGESASGGVENDGHGNNTDGVDSSNRGQGQGGPTGAEDASCPEGGECVDDEKVTGNRK